MVAFASIFRESLAKTFAVLFEAAMRYDAIGKISGSSQQF
jgi:hypothetical protein